MLKINHVDIEVINGELDEKEIKAYLEHIQTCYPHETLTNLTITIDGEYVDLQYHLKPQPIKRIRRITGYLVGTLERFNDAKKAEEKDRVKHHLS